MPEYLAPGVYVEETSYRAKTIEGVSTSTAGFIGPCGFGPTAGEPELLTSFADFERIYGGLDPLTIGTTATTNYMAHAARAFFEEGGKRLYVVRVANGGSSASAAINDGGDVTVAARYSGSIATGTPVSFGFKLGQNVLGQDGGINVLHGVAEFDVVLVDDDDENTDPAVYWLEKYFDDANQKNQFRLVPEEDGAAVTIDTLVVGTHTVQVISMSVTVGGMGRFGQPKTYEGMSLNPNHGNAFTSVFASKTKGANRATQMFVPVTIEATSNDPVTIANALLAKTNSLGSSILNALVANAGDALCSFSMALSGGTDGNAPTVTEYEGSEGASKTGFKVLEDLEDISIVAAPGSSAGYAAGSDSDAIIRLLVSHCERMRYRIAVLDSGNAQLPSQVRAMRATFDSTHAALYYPWITVQDPVTRKPLNLPPSGFVAGIYARNDVEVGVHKAPANEVVRLATGFETILNKAQQDVLNPEGINCFRFFEGRGFRLWGARTISSDSEWKYVNVRRYFAYLERSIEKSTQWVVFENNHDPLWGRVRRTVEDFLFNEWKNSRVMGRKPDEAYFVRCDRSTMTQNDIDNGRLICEIGVSPVKPAEFVIFRIGQWTADAQS